MGMRSDIINGVNVSTVQPSKRAKLFIFFISAYKIKMKIGTNLRGYKFYQGF
jgi:hypothetical protein